MSNYPVPPYGVTPPVPPPASGVPVKLIVCIVVTVIVLLLFGAIAIALGVGLGVGLSRRNSGSSGSSSSSGSTSSPYSILAPPTVSCTYSGSATCGCAATQPSFLAPRIVQGYTANANSWPWIVALTLNNGQALCGGFLVNYQYVVTAAHCVSGVAQSSIKVYAGLQLLSASANGQVRTVSNLNTHPSYSASGFINDIAVLKLTTAFDQTSKVGICCLTSDTSLPSLGETGVIAGWGTTSTSSSAISDNLLQGTIKVQGDSSSCSSSANGGIRFCAGYSGTDACFGDSGSPFMISLNNSWTCTGLVSAGRGCGQNSLYTRVSAFRSYIDSMISTL